MYVGTNYESSKRNANASFKNLQKVNNEHLIHKYGI